MKLSFFARVGNALETFYSAGMVASAVENHRRPHLRDLDRLGISRKAFEQIQR